jgi:hypothetical protein
MASKLSPLYRNSSVVVRRLFQHREKPLYREAIRNVRESKGISSSSASPAQTTTSDCTHSIFSRVASVAQLLMKIWDKPTPIVVKTIVLAREVRTYRSCTCTLLLGLVVALPVFWWTYKRLKVR